MLPFAEPEHVSLFFGCCVLRFVARHYVRRTRRNTTSKVSGLCHVFRWFWSDVRCLSICRTRSRPSLRMYGETRDRRCVRAAKYELCTDARRPACGGTRTALRISQQLARDEIDKIAFTRAVAFLLTQRGPNIYSLHSTRLALLGHRCIIKRLTFGLYSHGGTELRSEWWNGINSSSSIVDWQL